MTRKFLFCFPLRAGNIVFGYILLTISILVVAYHLYMLGVTIVTHDSAKQPKKFDNWENLEEIFGQNRQALVYFITVMYYISYLIIGMMLFIFSTIYTSGACKASYCLVSTFFVYSFFHLFLTIGLIVWEATSSGWIQLGLILAFDLLLIICLFSVKYLMEAIRSGHIYNRPGEIYEKY